MNGSERETTTDCNFVQRREKERERDRDGVGEGTGEEEWDEEGKCDARRERVQRALSSHLTGGREKGYIRWYPTSLRGLGIARRTHEEGIFARGASLPSPSTTLPPSSPLSRNPRFLFSLSFSLLSSHSDRFLGSILRRQPFRYSFVSLYPATCRIRRFPTNGPIEITRPVVFGLRAYREWYSVLRKPP